MDLFFAARASVIIATFVLLLHLAGYMAQYYFSAEAVWTVVGLIDAFFGYKCGMNIKSIFKDNLTGLYNRNYFSLFLNKLSTDRTNGKEPISLLMVDIDDFKNVNDTYGHLVGDIVLRQLAIVMKKSVRKTDRVVRWGGEEFAVVLPGADQEETVKVAERLRQAVEEFEFNSSPVVLRCTVSIGAVSVYDVIDHDRILNAADKALYQAKQSKNIVIAY